MSTGAGAGRVEGGGAGAGVGVTEVQVTCKSPGTVAPTAVQHSFLCAVAGYVLSD